MKANKFFAIALAALTLMACDKKNEPTQTLTITPATAEVAVAATVQLTANMDVTWSSSDATIASVNETGLVVGVKEGKATITARGIKVDALATCEITVKAGGVTPPPTEIPEIDITDNSLADWDALPAEFVFSAVCPEDAALLGLKSVKVYATEMYINVVAEPNMEDILLLGWVPFHMYIDADNSDLTGGYGDEFTDANTDILLEGAVFAGPDPENDPATGEPCEYTPAVFKWWGEVGGSGWTWTDPSVAHDASDYWGAIIGNAFQAMEVIAIQLEFSHPSNLSIRQQAVGTIRLGLYPVTETLVGEVRRVNAHICPRSHCHEQRNTRNK